MNESIIISIVATNSDENSTDFGVESLYAKNIGVNDVISFEHPDRTITTSKILNYYTPSNNDANYFGGTLQSSDTLIGINTGQFSFKKVEDSNKTFTYSAGIISCVVGTISPPQVGDYISTVKATIDGVLVSIIIPDGVMVTSQTCIHFLIQILFS